jgi:SAM-dependent methyltransferase
VTDWDWKKSREKWNTHAKRKKDLAAGFGAWSEEKHNDQTEKEQALIQACLPPVRIHKILDFGCGVGRMSQWLHKCYPMAEYVGVDFSKEMLAVARENNPILRYDLIEDWLPFKDEFFGGIFTCTVLQHIVVEKELSNIVSELSRVLRRGGIAILFENVEPIRQPGNLLHVLFRKPEEYIELFEKHGIALEKKASGLFQEQEHAVFVGRKH